MNLATTLHDPEGAMLEQARRILPKIRKLFKNVCVAMTDVSHEGWIELLDKHEFVKVEGGSWNEGRKNALADLLSRDKDSLIALFDFDKVLHICDKNFSIFEEFLEKRSYTAMLGRTAKAWKTYPNSWSETEGIANRLANTYFDTYNHDYIVGAWILSPIAAQLVVDKSVNKSFDAAFEYVQIIKAQKMMLEYVEADFLDWEDPDRNQADIKRLGFENWKLQRFEGLIEWKKRIRNLEELVRPLQ